MAMVIGPGQIDCLAKQNAGQPARDRGDNQQNPHLGHAHPSPYCGHQLDVATAQSTNQEEKKENTAGEQHTRQAPAQFRPSAQPGADH